MTYVVKNATFPRLFDDAALSAEQVQKLPSDVVQEVFRAIDAQRNLPHGKSQISEEVRASTGDKRVVRALKRVRDAAYTFAPEACLTAKPRSKAEPLRIPEKAPRNWIQKVGEYNYEDLNDCNAIARNVMSAVGKFSSAVAFSGVFGGIASFQTGSRIFQQGCRQLDTASDCKDREGAWAGRWDIWTGASLNLVGASMFAQFLPTAIQALPGVVGQIAYYQPISYIFENFPYLVPALQYLGPIALAGLSIGLIGRAMTTLPRALDFRRDLHSILDSSDTSQTKALRAMEFLYDELALTKTEIEEIGNNPEAIQQKLKEKWGRFVRVVGEKTAKEIALKLADVLRGVLNGEPDALQEAIRLVTLADRGCSETILKDAIQLILAAIYLTLAILSIINPAGPVLLILFAIGAGLWLFYDNKFLFNGLSKALIHTHDKDRWPILAFAEAKETIQDDLRLGVKIILNGEAIPDLWTLLQRLHLDGVDINKPWPKKRKEKAIVFLRKLNQGLLDKTREYFDDKVLKDKAGNSDPAIIEASYDLATGVGSISAKKRFRLFEPCNREKIDIYDVFVNADGTFGYQQVQE
jgi:hypothetical protein